MCLAQVRIQPRRLWDVVSPAHSVSPSESNSCRRVWNQGRRLPHHRLPWTVHRSGSPADQHIFLPFFGGPDDRLALSLVVQLCAGDSGVTATVVRVRKTGGAEVVYATEEAKTTVHNVRVSRLEWNGMLIHNRFFQTVFPDTVYVYSDPPRIRHRRRPYLGPVYLLQNRRHNHPRGYRQDRIQ